MLVMVLARATGRLLQRIYLNVFGYVVLNPAHIATCFLFVSQDGKPVCTSCIFTISKPIIIQCMIPAPDQQNTYDQQKENQGLSKITV